jgi:hypothetical protein
MNGYFGNAMSSGIASCRFYINYCVHKILSLPEKRIVNFGIFI